MLDKKGEGTAFGWLLALVTLVGVGVIFIILNQVMSNNIIPAFDGIKNSQGLNETQIAEINNELDWYNALWGYLPLVIFVIVIIWLVINAVRRNKEEMYQ